METVIDLKEVNNFSTFASFKLFHTRIKNKIAKVSDKKLWDGVCRYCEENFLDTDKNILPHAIPRLKLLIWRTAGSIDGVKINQKSISSRYP